MSVNKYKQNLGKWGEDVACWWLRRKGYEIIGRRFRTQNGEADVIASRGEELLFIEVKTRRSSSFGGIPEILSERNWDAKAQVACDFMQEHPEYSGKSQIMGLIGVIPAGTSIRIFLNFRE